MDACQELNKYTNLTKQQQDTVRELKKIFEAEDPKDRILRIKACEWWKFQNFILDVLQKGIDEGRKRAKIDIKRKFNKFTKTL